MFFPPFVTSDRVDAGEHESIYTHITMALNMDRRSLTIFKVSKNWYKSYPLTLLANILETKCQVQTYRLLSKYTKHFAALIILRTSWLHIPA